MAFWLNRCTLSLRCANANSISRRRKQKTRDLRHLTFQVSVINLFGTSISSVLIVLFNVCLDKYRLNEKQHGSLYPSMTMTLCNFKMATKLEKRAIL